MASVTLGYSLLLSNVSHNHYSLKSYFSYDKEITPFRIMTSITPTSKVTLLKNFPLFFLGKVRGQQGCQIVIIKLKNKNPKKQQQKRN